jgi:O-antigen biosynthesis protein
LRLPSRQAAVIRGEAVCPEEAASHLDRDAHADDASASPHVRRILEEYARLDARIKVVQLEQHGHISQASNAAFSLVSGACIAFLDHDDLLREYALAEIALHAHAYPDAELFYRNEDKIDETDTIRFEPYFKPDWAPDTFRSLNYLNHLTVHRAANIRKVGGWRTGFEGSQDYDLNLRIIEQIGSGRIVHIPQILYHWRARTGSAAKGADEKHTHTTRASRRWPNISRERTPRPGSPPWTECRSIGFAIPCRRRRPSFRSSSRPGIEATC